MTSKSTKGTLPIFLVLTQKLLSTDDNKRNQRINLSQKITSTIMNKQQFLSHLHPSSNLSNLYNLSLQQQSKSNHFKLCQRCIDLLQHQDHQIHLFGKLLFQKIIINNNNNNNNILKHILFNLIFDSYTNIIPNSLIHYKSISKLKTIILIIDAANNDPIINKKYSKQINSLKTAFIKLYDTLLSDNNNKNKNESLAFDAVPYKLPSIEVQTILINFWSKHPEYIPNDSSFRTMYLLRWICVLPQDFDELLINKLVHIMCIKFNDNDISNTSECILMLFGMLAFLGGSIISINDDNKPSNLLYKVLEQIPFSAMKYLNNNFGQILKNLPNQTVRLIIKNLLDFPNNNDKVSKWQQCFYGNLEKHRYFERYAQWNNNNNYKYIAAPINKLSLVNKPGLTNINMVSCYMNSIIQILSLSEEFRERLLSLKVLKYDANRNKQQNVFKLDRNEWIKMNFIMIELQNILKRLKLYKTKKASISTKKFVSLLPLPWSARQQQDGHQFIKYILDLLWETIKHSNCTLNDYTMTDIDPFFGGLQCGFTKCCKCGNITKKYDKFNEISLPLLNNKNNMNQLIDKYFDFERLTKENKYKCFKCNQYVEAMRYFKIMDAPKNLIICLKRMEWKSYKNQIRSIKNCQFINCPLTVSLPIDINKNENKNENDIKYLLYGAVIHSGNSSQCGHYYTIGRNTNNAIKAYHENNEIDNAEWYRFDDENVTKSSFKKLYYASNDVPYLLFYKKIKHEIKENDIECKEDDDVDQVIMDGEKIEIKS